MTREHAKVGANALDKWAIEIGHGRHGHIHELVQT
jgi:hypothetical protein